MDNIWYENPSKSEVIGPCGGDEKTEWPRRTEKSRTKKICDQMSLTFVVISTINVYQITHNQYQIRWSYTIIYLKKIHLPRSDILCQLELNNFDVIEAALCGVW